MRVARPIPIAILHAVRDALGLGSATCPGGDAPATPGHGDEDAATAVRRMRGAGDVAITTDAILAMTREPPESTTELRDA
ncbi:hypothetical protein BDZ31_003186 [Conexibacter arvalis]|uniref:Uncharacterized protein n=1 Tax=Conexibacter arvalis TaxID=912552 RepID=A0A840IH85_9ACTN|nr:hypothetical protein [Conexibacter arvalis]